MSISLIAASVLLFAAAPPQDSRPSVATLIEKARVLAEEKGQPTKAVLLLLDKVICRNDITKAQFDRATRMIVIYKGGKPPKESPASAPNNLQGDFRKGIQKEIAAYLAGKGAASSLTWFGKAAFPFLLESLKKNGFRPDDTKKLIPLLIATDLKAATAFLRDLRRKGSPLSKKIVERALAPSPQFKKLPSGLRRAFLQEILAWAAESPRPESVLRPFLRWFEDAQFLGFLESHPYLGRRNLDLLASFLRTRPPVTLVRSDYFLGVIGKALRGGPKPFPKRLGAYQLVPWLLMQPKGFPLAVSLFSYPQLRPWSWDPRKIPGSKIPRAREGLPVFLKVLAQNPRPNLVWGTLDNCLAVWEEDFRNPDPTLQEELLRLMDRLLAFTQSSLREGKWWFNRITSRVLQETATLDAQFQIQLWDRLLHFTQHLEILMNSSRIVGQRQVVNVVGGAELLLFHWKENKQPLLSYKLDRDQRIQVVLKALEADNNWGRGMMGALFLSGDRIHGPVALSKDMKMVFLRTLVRKQGLVRKALLQRGSSWLLLLPEKEAKKVFFPFWEDPKTSTYQLQGFFWGQVRRERNPGEFIRKAFEKRPSLTPGFLSYGTVEKEYAGFLVDWLEAQDPAWIHGGWAAMIPAKFVPFPSAKARDLLARLLLSRELKVRKSAAEVLDGWKRLEGIQRDKKNRKLRKDLWAIVRSAQPIPARVVALEGLFDLGDKEAWLTLSRWLTSEDKGLREAASHLSRRMERRN